MPDVTIPLLLRYMLLLVTSVFQVLCVAAMEVAHHSFALKDKEVLGHAIHKKVVMRNHQQTALVSLGQVLLERRQCAQI